MIVVPQPGWPPLKPETIARKDGVNSPLLDTGEMRDSIAWNSDATDTSARAIARRFGKNSGHRVAFRPGH